MHNSAQAPAGTVTFSHAYPGRTDQAGQVRADLRALLDGCPITDEVILCASELAANAVVHSYSGYLDARFTVRVEVHSRNHGGELSS